MVGYISDAVANAIRNWGPLQAVNAFPVRATDGPSVVVDTPLPAIAIHVSGNDGHGNTYFGGGIRFYFDLELYVITPITNYSFTPDGGTQAKQLDIMEDVVRCMEQTKDFDVLRQKHDWNMQYDRTDTETTYATQGAMSITASVQKIVYKCDVEFDPKYAGDKDVVLEKIIIEPKNVENAQNN